MPSSSVGISQPPCGASPARNGLVPAHHSLVPPQEEFLGIRISLQT